MVAPAMKGAMGNPGDPGYEKYIRELTLLHALLVEAMKSKQGVDPATAEKMSVLAAEFEKSYFGEGGR